MITFRVRTLALMALMAVLSACSREQQDWRSAEAADTSEAYGRFLEQHPESELAVHARARVEQLAEERDWAHAAQVSTPDGYREFLAQHPSGKWTEEARIRIEAFALGSVPRTSSHFAAAGVPAQAASGVRALQLATANTPSAPVQQTMTEPALAPLVRGTGDTARARPVVAVPAVATVTAGAAYGVQLGAFGSQASADREWHRLQGRFGAQLGGLAPHIIPAASGSAPLYRLQVAAAGEAQARALCTSLKEQAQPCVPVLPQ
jgi:cell division protein FtsN